MKPLSADNEDGRTLLALRAGPMTTGEIRARVGGSVAGWLIKAGYVRQDDSFYRITDAGRAACPLRNPLAAKAAPAIFIPSEEIMTSLTDIERAARKYADARDHLATIVGTMNEGIESIKRDNIKRLKKAVADAADQHDVLKALIEQAPGCFIKPRSVVFHGIKLGFAKGKGKIEWTDADQVVRLIKKHYPEQADVLIATSERPAKEALAQLTAAELKKLGISVTDGGDAVFIKPADSAVDKMVDALLKDATAEVA